MQSKRKFNVSGFNPMIWIKSLRQSIPYLGSEAKSLKAHNDRIKVESEEKKPVKTGILEKIRSAHYGHTQFPGKENTGTPAAEAIKPEQKIETPAAAAVKLERKGVIHPKKEPVSENVTKDGNTFLENMQAIGEDLLGREPENTEFDIGADGNITRPDWTFEQNLAAMARALHGEGPGAGEIVTENVTSDKNTFAENMDIIANVFGDGRPIPRKSSKENVTDPNKSFLHNLYVIHEEFSGGPPAPGEGSKENVTDPDKGFLENLDAIHKEFRRTPDRKKEKTVTQRSIKGINC